MGYDVYIRNVVGFGFTKAETTTETQVRTCSHQQNTAHKSCSECGKPMWKTQQVTLDFTTLGYNVEEGGSSDDGALAIAVGKTVANFDVHKSKDVSFELSGRWFQSQQAKDFEAQLRRDLTAFGVDMKEREFGIHTLVFHST